MHLTLCLGDLLLVGISKCQEAVSCSKSAWKQLHSIIIYSFIKEEKISQIHWGKYIYRKSEISKVS